MNQKQIIDNIVEWTTDVYRNAFGSLIDYDTRALVTDLYDFDEEFRQRDQGKEIIESIEEEPNRAKNFNIGNNSILYIPKGNLLEPIFEETWHSVSPLKNGSRNEETFVVIARYLALREALREGKADVGRPKEIIENSITGEYTGTGLELNTVDERKYEDRNACLGLLEYFEQGNNGKPVEMDTIAKISKNILNEIVDGEAADRAIAKVEKEISTES